MLIVLYLLLEIYGFYNKPNLVKSHKAKAKTITVSSTHFVFPVIAHVIRAATKTTSADPPRFISLRPFLASVSSPILLLKKFCCPYFTGKISFNQGLGQFFS
jgi:hypothetical protein